MITIKGLSKQFGQTKVLEDINFSVSRGEILALLGPNGAGKTTLIRLLTGLLSPSQGEIFYDGIGLNQNRVAILNRIGYIAENAPLYNDMSVQEFLIFTAKLHNMRNIQIKELINMVEALKIVIVSLWKSFMQLKKLVEKIILFL